MEIISKERLNEVGYGILLLMLSKDSIELDPNKFKRKLGGLTKELAGVGVDVSREELQILTKKIVQDLVEYAFGFKWKNGSIEESLKRVCESIEIAKKEIVNNPKNNVDNVKLDRHLREAKKIIESIK